MPPLSVVIAFYTVKNACWWHFSAAILCSSGLDNILNAVVTSLPSLVERGFFIPF